MNYLLNLSKSLPVRFSLKYLLISVIQAPNRRPGTQGYIMPSVYKYVVGRLQFGENPIISPLFAFTELASLHFW
jgi:hypothetical protein